MTQNLALEDPDFDAADAISGVRLGLGVIDVAAKRVQRHPTFAIPFGPSDLGATETAGAGDPDALGAKPERRLDRALHRPAERDPALELVGRDRGLVIVRLNSGEQRYLRADCMGTVGAVSNPDNSNQTLAKAGRKRWMGVKPLTRGVAKNPVDHPHGGGEGRTSGGRHPVTPWGKPTKGARTRHNKQTDKMIIRSRHAKKKKG